MRGLDAWTCDGGARDGHGKDSGGRDLGAREKSGRYCGARVAWTPFAPRTASSTASSVAEAAVPLIRAPTSPWAYGARQTWTTAQHGTVEYCAHIVWPALGAPGARVAAASKLPVAMFFVGLGSGAHEIVKGLDAWRAIAPEPFVMILPSMPKKHWWFIDSLSTFGWIEGEYQRPLAERYSAFVAAVGRWNGIDSARIGLFGFSAGAYAVVELLAISCGGVRLSGVGLGGVHGHGQCDLTDIPEKSSHRARHTFERFLGRLSHHGGCRWIEATHGITDQQSRWEDARRIFEAKDQRQYELNSPRVSVRRLEACEQDILSSSKRSRAYHSYFNVAFMRPAFLIALLGGAAPPPDDHKTRARKRVSRERVEVEEVR